MARSPYAQMAQATARSYPPSQPQQNFMMGQLRGSFPGEQTNNMRPFAQNNMRMRGMGQMMFRGQSQLNPMADPAPLTYQQITRMAGISVPLAVTSPGYGMRRSNVRYPYKPVPARGKRSAEATKKSKPNQKRQFLPLPYASAQPIASYGPHVAMPGLFTHAPVAPAPYQNFPAFATAYPAVPSPLLAAQHPGFYQGMGFGAHAPIAAYPAGAVQAPVAIPGGYPVTGFPGSGGMAPSVFGHPAEAVVRQGVPSFQGGQTQQPMGNNFFAGPQAPQPMFGQSSFPSGFEPQSLMGQGFGNAPGATELPFRRTPMQIVNPNIVQQAYQQQMQRGNLFQGFPQMGIARKSAVPGKKSTKTSK